MMKDRKKEKKIEYSEPKLVNLDEGLFADGACRAGTAATGPCVPSGAAPGGQVCVSGYAAARVCRTGTGR